MNPFSTFAELAAFLMVYVARADGQAHYLEEATLTEQLKNFSPQSEKLLLEATRNYPALKDEKIEDILKANEILLRGASENDRQELIRSLFAVVNSDGRVQTEETSALRVIRAAVDAAQMQ